MLDKPLRWSDVLKDEKQADYFQRVCAFVRRERQQGKVIYPPPDQVFNAFAQTPFEHLKVVILGQDPYHGPDQAHGLAFSVRQHVALPPSLRNIYQELQDDLGITPPSHGNLTAWAQQGVFLLNTVLTVTQGRAHAHAGKGWETFTDQVIRHINTWHHNVVYILWGSNARKKAAMVNEQRNLVLQSPHPSPLSAHRGFFGSRPFSRANAYLQQHGQTPVDWRIPEATATA